MKLQLCGEPLAEHIDLVQEPIGPNHGIGSLGPGNRFEVAVVAVGAACQQRLEILVTLTGNSFVLMKRSPRVVMAPAWDSGFTPSRISNARTPFSAA